MDWGSVGYLFYNAAIFLLKKSLNLALLSKLLMIFITAYLSLSSTTYSYENDLSIWTSQYKSIITEAR